MPVWYRRLADVPGVRYPGSPGVDRRRLPGHNAVPTVSGYEFDGKRTETLSWSTTDGITSASPAQRHAIADQHVTTPAVLGRLREALELPGQASDYHFAL